MGKPSTRKPGKPSVVKPKTVRQKHDAEECGCTILTNPNDCPYQPFLDGWEFATDAGNGQTRGEIFTPRFIVDRMVTSGHILPPQAVYNHDYSGSQDTLRKIVGNRVFEPAVGTGNFTATVLWHKLEYANMLTSAAKTAAAGRKTGRGKKTVTQLRRYQTYTIVALASIYFNDVDAGNLQTVKWRLLRDGEINTSENVDYWTRHIIGLLTGDVNEDAVRETVTESIKTAGRLWGAADEDKGVLDVLYRRHTGQTPPEWLQETWKTVLDENAKLYNAVEEHDTVMNGCSVPGYGKVGWRFWWFSYDKDFVYAAYRRIPVVRQILANQIKMLNRDAVRVKSRGHLGEAADGMLPFGETFTFASEDDEKEYGRLLQEITRKQGQLATVEPYGSIEVVDIPRT